ncbi:Reticulon-like protein B5 [Vitis vinifera]|uniref:Reticulon-like protein n=1 Tax=Vitis vinifera TaxID=29760 RepID=A0A438G7B2_VITVI|nr:Reticulon-like protein B5 [Vitis vinifera]
MADHEGESESAMESVMEKITAKLHGHDSPSSSDSEDGKKSLVEAVKSKSFRLFGREKASSQGPRGWKTMNLSISSYIHTYIYFGAAADVFLWRNKKISASVLGCATAIWVLFEMLEYQLLPLLCHIVMLSLASLFLWSNASIVIKKSPPNIPEVGVPEKAVMEITSALLYAINRGLTSLHNIASGRHLKQFLAVTAGLWVLSAVGRWCDFITLFYLLFVLLHTVPVIYEKYEDEVDSSAEKVKTEIKNQYRLLCEKVLRGQPEDVLKVRKLS